MQIRLEGISRKGKNRVREHGELWNVIQIGKFGGQPAYLLESLANTLKMGSERIKDGRWVLMSGDPDFKITPNKDRRT